MSTTPETPTPETDDHSDRMDNEDFDVELALTYDLARRLERERDAARAEIKAMRAAISDANAALFRLVSLGSLELPHRRDAALTLGEKALVKLKPFTKP